MKFRLLDLFGGGGGCAKGYMDAGFLVVSVDIVPQPRNPAHRFVQADALEFLREHGHRFDAIHASPPCQGYTRARKLAEAQGKADKSPRLVEPIRQLLIATGKPYVIENVPGAPLRDAVTLCGSMFGLRVRRHRLFESSVMLAAPSNCRHKEQGRPVGVYHRLNDSIPGGGRTAATMEEAMEAMGIGWKMRVKDIFEAIPPAYARCIGEQLISYLERTATMSAEAA
jgi:DNA (cytosine-5)-methyltransferase 1